MPNLKLLEVAFACLLLAWRYFSIVGHGTSDLIRSCINFIKLVITVTVMNE